jgi:hypothetical protein
MHSLPAGATQSWFIVKVAVALSPSLIFWAAGVIGWLLRRTLWHQPETAPRSATKLACDEPTGVSAPPR